MSRSGRIYDSVIIVLLSMVLCVVSNPAWGRQVRLFGYVVDADNRGIEAANVYIAENTAIGTGTNQNGFYELMVEMGDTVTLVYSMVGYITIRQQVFTDRDVIGVNVVLPGSEEMLHEIQVRGIKRQEGVMESANVSVLRTMPDATGGGIESLLITFAGVSQNNELSSQYNVRGGTFDENAVQVNGLEVHRPLLIRSGQQEGLSFVNLDMVQSVDFAAGGFDAQYGDKMSSVLDIRYKRPTQLESHLSLALLGASAYVGFGDSIQSQMHGIRYKTSRYMLGALETKGNYQPNFIDYQTQMTWLIGEQKRWEIAFLGNYSRNSYIFIPDSLSTSFGSVNQAMNKTIWYEGQEKDLFQTLFAAVSSEGRLTPELTIGFDLSGFYTNERETYDISSEYVLSEQPLDGSSTSVSHGERIGPDAYSSVALGTGNNHEHARNTLQAGVILLQHRGQWHRGHNQLQWGINGQLELIDDHISEWEWRDSMGYSIPNENVDMALYYALKGSAQMVSARLQSWVQDTYTWPTEDGGKVRLTAGARLNYWSYTGEVLTSPRVSVCWMPGWKRDVTLRAALGMYYQAPFYKELRQVVTDESGVSRIHLNNHLQAQRSYQLVVGSDYYFRAWGRPFKFTAELYGKYIDRMESYTVDNVRVRYSGEIDSRGYTIGADLKLYGELVPGADSWISFSTMRSRMHMINDTYNLGWFPTPQEQRYSFTMYFQDYIPRLPQYKLHLKFIWSEGLPFGYPRSEQMRYLGRMSDYRRIDIGFSRTFSARHDQWMKSARHVEDWSVQLEVFNLVGWKNVNSYYWVTAADGKQWASPNYLTGRMWNLKFDVRLK